MFICLNYCEINPIIILIDLVLELWIQCRGNETDLAVGTGTCWPTGNHVSPAVSYNVIYFLYAWCKQWIVTYQQHLIYMTILVCIKQDMQFRFDSGSLHFIKTKTKTKANKFRFNADNK